jgi:serine/threonine protein kinase
MHQTLLDLLQQQSGQEKIDREQVRLIVYQMVKALQFIHSKNVNYLLNLKGCAQRYQA